MRRGGTQSKSEWSMTSASRPRCSAASPEELRPEHPPDQATKVRISYPLAKPAAVKLHIDDPNGFIAADLVNGAGESSQ